MTASPGGSAAFETAPCEPLEDGGDPVLSVLRSSSDYLASSTPRRRGGAI
eukprot:CAMPEP_0170493152 /NCGR_PEP_ID=MMETSP0208-20121228/13437_1 /TAXON_ID=197538 /ORGANISM="Strombidium inclinatum, Strain S3" /LENGTH=49 /DNA_ID=CAMNT_0010769035 /DNA_START=241 /DNA_END=390 /DNA_ORIENTATION=-